MFEGIGRGLREPVNGFLHLGGLILGLVGTVWMVAHLWPDPTRVLSALVYGLTMCGCFAASTLHHLVRGSRATEVRLLRIDHAAIFPFIAGSYTPICQCILPDGCGLGLLALVWVIAVVGAAYKLFWAPEPERIEDPPDLPSVLVYVVMGCLILWQIRALVAAAIAGSVGLAILGGVLYIAGGLILARRWLDFWPGRFGHHEIWHVCVVAGAACHYGFLFVNLTTG